MTRTGSLFSGYAGLELGLALAGEDQQMAFFADIKPVSVAVLQARYPYTPNVGDVTEVDWLPYGQVDRLIGGFPCTDVSLAGGRAGLVDGSRSGLWREFARAIASLQPREVFIENVRGLLSARADSPVEPCPVCLGDAGGKPLLRALGAVLGDLSDLGYDARWTTLPASGVGAAHQRQRVFILARRRPADPASEGLEDGREGRPAPGAAADTSGQRHGDGGPAGVAGLQAAAVSGGAAAMPAAAVKLLPTPRTSDVRGGGQHGTGGLDLRTAVTLLPTPSAVRAGRNRSQSAGAAVRPSLDQVDQLLPTPKASDGVKGGPNQHGSSGDLTLPSAVMPEQWGKYAPAIARWERIMGRPAPAPTMLNRNGRPALAPPFVEWLMGLQEGYVTDVDLAGTPASVRNQRLSALGDGVVPQQVAAAWAYLNSPIEGYW